MRKDKQRNIQRIQQLIKGKGPLTAKELAKETGLSEGAIYSYAKQGHITLLSKSEHTIQKIQDTLREKGPMNLRELAEETEMSYGTLSIYENQGYFEAERMPRGRQKGTTRIPSRDELITQGISQIEIGRREGVSGDAIRQYINNTEQYELWKKAKQSIPENRKHIATLIGLLAEQKAEEENGLEGKMVMTRILGSYNHVKNSARSEKSLEKRYKEEIHLLKLYNKAEEQGKKMSYEDFQELTGIFFVQAGILLRNHNKKPLTGSNRKPRVCTPKEKKEAIQRTFALPYSPADIGHFLELPCYIVDQTWRRIGKRKRAKILGKIEGPSSKHLNLRTASQIYEAQDLGFNNKEIIELLDLEEQEITKYQKRRKKLEKPIREILQTIYPQQTHNKPYLEQ